MINDEVRLFNLLREFGRAADLADGDEVFDERIVSAKDGFELVHQVLQTLLHVVPNVVGRVEVKMARTERVALRAETRIKHVVLREDGLGTDEWVERSELVVDTALYRERSRHLRTACAGLPSY